MSAAEGVLGWLIASECVREKKTVRRHLSCRSLPAEAGSQIMAKPGAFFV